MLRRSFVLLLFLVVAAAFVQGHTIKHVVVLMEENRSFDHIFGWAAKLLGINGLTGKENNPVSTLNPTEAPPVFVNSTAPYIAMCDPHHETISTAMKIFGLKNLIDKNYTECMCGFVEMERATHRSMPCASSLMDGFPPERLPVFVQLAQQYAIMDDFFCSVPGPTWPNRQFFLAATSGGSTETFNWYEGTPGKLFPQRTFFDQLEDEGLSWRLYYADTPWELFMEKFAKSPDHLETMDAFYAAAASGNLPNYTFINPRSAINVTSGEGSNDMHPDHDVRLAERLVKDVYEAVRNSPAWNDTLFILTFDEHGGFYDHVDPPTVGVPPPDGIPAWPDWYFKFDRLGIRIPMVLISPWIAPGTVISAPPAAQKPFNTSQYDLTSIMSTVRKVFGMASPPLTKRDAWAATFEHAVEQLREPRADRDCPRTLHAAYPIGPQDIAGASVSNEATQPLNDLQKFIMGSHLHLQGRATSPLKTQPEARSGTRKTIDADEHDTIRTPVADVSHIALTQGTVSEWLQAATDAHKDRTRRWLDHHHKRHKQPATASMNASYHVRVVPMVNLTALLKGFEKWQLNYAAGNSTTPGNGGNPLVTISSMTLGVPHDETQRYCLTWLEGDHHAQHPETRRHRRMGLSEGPVEVGVAPCYPTSDPSRNLDITQRWLWLPDATVRPTTNSMFCLTTHVWSGDETLVVEPCVTKGASSTTTSEVEQRWMYQGSAPGNENTGFIQFGNGIYSIAVVEDV